MSRIFEIFGAGARIRGGPSHRGVPDAARDPHPVEHLALVAAESPGAAVHPVGTVRVQHLVRHLGRLAAAARREQSHHRDSKNLLHSASSVFRGGRADAPSVRVPRFPSRRAPPRLRFPRRAPLRSPRPAALLPESAPPLSPASGWKRPRPRSAHPEHGRPEQPWRPLARTPCRPAWWWHVPRSPTACPALSPGPARRSRRPLRASGR